MQQSTITRGRDLVFYPGAGRILVAVCELVVASGTYSAVSHLSTPRAIGAWGAAALFLAAFPLVYLRGVPLIPVCGLAGVALQLLAPSNGAFIAVIASIAYAGARIESRAGRLVAAISGFGFLAATAVGPHGASRTELLSSGSGFLFAYLAASSVRRLRVEQRRTEQLLQEVIAGRDAVAQNAVLEERARLAREIHDILAHTLSALSIQLEGAQLLVQQRPENQALATTIERSSRLAREGLLEARRAVGSLRGDNPPGPELLPQLATDFEQDSGISCRLRIEGELGELSTEVRLALYRTAQEALTNVRKHAEASSVNICLRADQDGAQLTVDDQGRPRPETPTEGGHGLQGMRERAELLGGRLEAGPTADGFRVCLWVPR